MSSAIVIYAAILGYLGFTMYRANQEVQVQEQQTGVRALLMAGVVLIFLLGLYTMMLAASTEAARELQEQGEEVLLIEVSATTAFLLMAFCGVSGGFGLAVLRSEQLRQSIERVIGERGTYNAASIVHTTAIIFILLIATANTVVFVVEGGASGMAESIDTQGIPITLPVFEAVIEVIAAFLGIGYAIRRMMPAALDRLGLRWPTREDMVNGTITALLLLGTLIVFGVIITLLLSTEQIEEMNEAANSLAGAFTTLPRAVILSLSAAIGEEIFFRGALQPVFGNVLVSVFFAILHTQSLFTPGVVLLFVVSMLLGRVRNRHSTTAAIIAHFLYNFIQLLFVISAGEAV